MSQYRSEDIFRCVCGDPAHYFTVSTYEYEGKSIEDSEVYVSVCLSSFYGFWQRLWQGIKYVFFNERIQFDEVILDLHDQEYLIDRLHSHYIKHMNKNKVDSQDKTEVVRDETD